jgi:hypothetical protein
MFHLKIKTIQSPKCHVSNRRRWIMSIITIVIFTGCIGEIIKLTGEGGENNPNIEEQYLVKFIYVSY